MAEVWDDVETDSFSSPFQYDRPEEEDEEEQKRKSGREIDNLSSRLDALQDTEETDDPSKKETEGKVPLDIATLINCSTSVQHLIIEIFFAGTDNRFRHILQPISEGVHSVIETTRHGTCGSHV